MLFKLLVLGTLLATVAVGVMARTGSVSAFYAADANQHPAPTRLAIAASAMPAAWLATLAGVLP
jgi:Na+(H+)/acetate symporter ActP